MPLNPFNWWLNNAKHAAACISNYNKALKKITDMHDFKKSNKQKCKHINQINLGMIICI